MAVIYGIDTDKVITPLMVRDAIIECFYQAHCADSSLGLDDSEVNAGYCGEIIKKAFSESGGDFEKPTKESILGVLDWLRCFAKNFRDPKIIEKHSMEIMKLVEKLND